MNYTRTASMCLRIAMRRVGGTSHIFSTSVSEQEMIKTLVDDLRDKDCSTVGTTLELHKPIAYGELDHLDSPQADAAHLEHVRTEVDSLFSRLPLPDDPMKTALEPSGREVAEQEGWDVLKEMVRERYHRSIALRAAEKARIEGVMKRYQQATDEPMEPDIPKGATSTEEAERIRRRIEHMKLEIAQLEKKLETADRFNN
uniref:Uncharacterized protein TCIL3000_11_11780 n=1 Tax=Trypanosoma congolense (strain IL3000) TaxID=1068625 RepID=G0V214_TRYCI|nr:unnamed protein product [Trypanosoma congolense IL3000]